VPVRLKLLLLLLSLGIAAMALLATHCEGYPDCGHVEGAECPTSACVILPLPSNGSPLICGGGSGGGGGGGSATPIPTQDPGEFYPYHVGEYSHSSAVGCSGSNNAIDPITLLVRRTGEETIQHLDHHGLGTGGQGIDDQYFEEKYPSCVRNEIGEASCGLACSRWHARGHQLQDFYDPWAPTERMTALTPHWDELVWDIFDCGAFPNHVVPEDFYGDDDGEQMLSGFVVARDHVTSEWLDSPEHDVVGVYDFDNTVRLRQCNNEEPRSDGIVYHLR